MRRRRNLQAFLLLAALSVPLGACGWAEWPPPDSRFDRSRRAPAGQAQTQTPPPAPAPAAAPVARVSVESSPIAEPPGVSSRLSSAPVSTAPSALPPPSAPVAPNVPHPSLAPATVRPPVVTVERGETIYALARRYKVSPRAIIEANQFKPPYHVQAGQKVVIPQGRDHVVSGGETLYTVAQRYAVDPYRLARANGLEPPYALKVGEQLVVPSTEEAGVNLAAVPPRAATAPHPSSMPSLPASPSESSPAEAPSVAPGVPPPSAHAPLSEPMPHTGKGFGWPVRGKVLSGYGTKAKGLRNDGINIAAPAGAPVRAAQSGVVAYAGNELRGFGNLVLVQHADGYVTAYAHNDSLSVKRGETVKRGQIIARVGATGSVTRPQLHFEIRQGRKAIDPMPYLEAGSPARAG